MSYEMVSLPEAWQRPVFVIATGRSGSTLLTRYLNCAADLVVWGEHAGIIHHLATAYGELLRPDIQELIEEARPWVAQMLAKQAVIGSLTGMTLEWVNGFDRASIDHAFRQLAVNLFTVGLSRTTRWGFKEIRYGGAEMAFLRALFPKARFILLVRGPTATLKSKFRCFAREDIEHMPEQFSDTLAFLNCAAVEVASGAADVLPLHYERLTQDTCAEIARISAFIGSRFIDEQVWAIEQESTGAVAFETEVAANIAKFVAEIGLDVSPADIECMAEAYEALLLTEARREPVPVCSDVNPVATLAN